MISLTINELIRKKYFWYMSVLLVVLFGMKDILVLMFSDYSHIYAVTNTCRQTFEETYLYLPMISNLSIENITKYFFTGGYIIPPAFLLVGKIIFYFCYSNIDIFLLMVHIAFPLISFWIIFLIYNRYISVSWALLLAFLGIMFFNNFSLAKYFLHILQYPSQWISAASLDTVEITRFPFPSFSFLYFILCFYLSIKNYKISFLKYLLLSFLWASNIYVYQYNFIVGILFWFGYVVFTHYLSYKNKSDYLSSLVKLLFVNIILILFIIFPVLIKILFLSKEVVGGLGTVERFSGAIFNSWGLLISYILPLIITFLIIIVYCADYYELFFKFTPIFIMIILELIILNSHLLVGISIQPSLFSIRIGNFFSRYLYFVPVIYFFSLPVKKLMHSNTKTKIITVIHDFLYKYIIQNRRIIASLGIGLISFLVFTSSLKYYFTMKYYQTDSRMQLIHNRLDEMLDYTEDSKIIVSEDIAVNLLVPMKTNRTSLLISSFNSVVPKKDVLKSLVIYAHIFMWDEDQFLDFMMPDHKYYEMYNKNNFIISDEMLTKGFGYWLLEHRHFLASNEEREYKDRILNIFRNIQIQEEIKNIGIIQAKNEINPAIEFVKMKDTEDMKIYYLRGIN
ncbi:hypothetical protein ACFL4A_00725 [bacterium]